jgi:hypothetical protein
MKHRNFRIAWSVAWGVVAMLLVALWVRSFDAPELVRGYCGLTNFGFVSQDGELWVFIFTPGSYSPRWIWFPGPNRVTQLELDYWRNPWFVPYWLPVISIGIVTAAPWLPRRFSLRTQFIATTLFALVLGLVVCMTRAD